MRAASRPASPSYIPVLRSCLTFLYHVAVSLTTTPSTLSRRTRMTANIGNKHIAQHRGKKERLEIYKTNVTREAIRQAAARAKYRNQQKGKPLLAATAA